MKRTQIRRKTPLKAKTGILSRKSPKKRSKVAKCANKRPSSRLLKNKLWAECKRIIRARHGNTCYTCGKSGLDGSGWQTGHFIPSSVCSVEMRYSLDNLRPQCYHCNINLSGNWIAYEEHLQKDGIDTKTLKQTNEQTKNRQYDLLWYLNKIEEYKQL